MSDTEIRGNTLLPARREEIELHTADGLTLVGELALPVEATPVATIVALLREVRSTDYLAAWFREGESELTARIANSSPIIEALALSFFAGPPSERATQLTRWCIRVTMSLLITPGADADDERRTLELFVAPLVRTSLKA